MQNRYFGDVGDFGKYGLLRRICGVSAGDEGEALSLGVVWYLVGDPSHNEDGKHTTYLDKPEEYRDCDPGLFDGLKSLLDGPGPRAVSMIEPSGLELLPHGTKYVSEPLTREGRSEWLSRAIDMVRDCDVVFLDPDIGFQPPSVRVDSKKAVQYVLWTEAERFYEFQERQTLIFYHHLNRAKRWDGQIDDKLHEIGSRLGGGESAIPLLFKRGTGRVFFVLPSEEHRDLVTSRVLGMVNDVHWRKHARIGSAGKGVRASASVSRRPERGDSATSRTAGLAGDVQRRKRTMSAAEKATVRVGTWNVQFAKSDLAKGSCVAKVLAAPDCDILCVSEVGDADILPKGGNVIDAGTDWGYSIPKASPGRRKVLLWSKRPWTRVVDPLQGQLPGGRLVAGVTETPIGKMTVVGVCIPWSGAHVFTGGKNRLPWEDHQAWVAGFRSLEFGRGSTIVLGDFNQAFPRVRTPPLLSQALRVVLEERGLRVVTEGFLEPPAPTVGDVPGPWQVELSDTKPGDSSVQLIDHIAHSGDLGLHRAAEQREGARRVGIFPRKGVDGVSLSDHNGVWVDLKA